MEAHPFPVIVLDKLAQVPYADPNSDFEGYGRGLDGSWCLAEA